MHLSTELELTSQVDIDKDVHDRQNSILAVLKFRI